MSRRSRRRGTVRRQGWLGKIALGLVLAGVLAAAIVYACVRSYLYSDAFRKFLSAKASAVAQVNGEFTPFRWDGLAVDTDAFEASGNGIIKTLRVDGLHTEVGVGGLRRGVWEIRESRVQRLELALDARNRAATAAIPLDRPPPPPPQPRQPTWLPSDVALQGLDLREVVVKALLDSGSVSISGMKVRVEPSGKKSAYRAEVVDGIIRLPFEWMPEFRIKRASLRCQNNRICVNKATAAVWNDGCLETSGEWDLDAGRYAFEAMISGVKCSDLLNEDWSKRFIGDVQSHFSLDNADGEPVASGRMDVRDGTLTALPMLDSLAAYADTRRFRVLSLSEAHADWKCKKGELGFTHLVLASEGLVRLEGDLFIRDRQLDGTFRLGLAPGTLSRIPGAETNVFSPGALGLVWAPLRITGSLDDPKEDLTDRLVMAAGLRMFDVIPETGEKVIKFSRSLLGDSPSSAVDKGVKIIEEGGKVLQQATGLFDGMLGGANLENPRKATDPPPQAPVPDPPSTQAPAAFRPPQPPAAPPTRAPVK